MTQSDKLQIEGVTPASGSKIDPQWERHLDNLPPDPADPRTPGVRDHDRIFYSSEFGRLEGITQIATTISTSVHNRLTHSYRVEQVAREIAKRFAKTSEVDPDVVAAAALGHDIGHAPFGHTGEIALQEVLLCKVHRKKPTAFRERAPIRVHGNDVLEDESLRNALKPACDSAQPCVLMDGFEGNAQSFRILTLLAAKRERSFNQNGQSFGLDLTRRVLLAGLKYPWLFGEGPKAKKWGVYDSDLEIYAWVLQEEVPAETSVSRLTREQSLEAQIMDTADDIAYAVHDLEDFHRAGVIPLQDLYIGSETVDRLMRYIRQDVDKSDGPLKPVLDEYQRALDERARVSASADAGEIQQITAQQAWDGIIDRLGLVRLAELNNNLQEVAASRYRDSYESRATLTRIRSHLISQFINDLKVTDGKLSFENDNVKYLMEFLKQLTWYYVIEDPALLAIREGQMRMVKECFDFLLQSATSIYLSGQDNHSYAWKAVQEPRGIPERLADYIQLGRERSGRYLPVEVLARAVVDYICSLTDSQVYTFASQLAGSQAQAVPSRFVK